MEIWNAIAAISTLIASVVIVITALIAVIQLREMKRATIAQAFATILTYLRAPEAREARRVLVHTEQADFSKWTDEQIQKSELACSTWDAIGILLRREVVDPKMVTKEWRDSITRCWEHAVPMTMEFRRDRGFDFWDDFEWLYQLAKKGL